MSKHFPKDMRSFFKQIITASDNGKEAKKGAEKETVWSMNTLPDHFSTTIFFYQC